MNGILKQRERCLEAPKKAVFAQVQWMAVAPSWAVMKRLGSMWHSLLWSLACDDTTN